jgi:hypothetical protein
LEYNFGHGQEHLAACLLTLNLLASLVHTVLQLTDPAYGQLRHKRGTRKGFFQVLNVKWLDVTRQIIVG